MTTTEPATTLQNPGVDFAIRELVTSGAGWRDYHSSTYARGYLDLLVHATHPARDHVDALFAELDRLANQPHPPVAAAPAVEEETGSESDAPPAAAASTASAALGDLGKLAGRLRAALDAIPIHILAITTAEQLRRFRDDYELREDWHEPDNQGIGTIISPGGFDNTSAAPHHLEQFVFFTHLDNDDDGPVGPFAAANLACVCSWATGYER